MKKIETILNEEKCQLEKVVKEARKRLITAPKGRLRIAKKRKGVEYYYKSDLKDEDTMGPDGSVKKKNNNGRYVKKSEMKFVRELAQRDYDEQLVGRGEARIKAIEKFLEKYNTTDLRDLYRKINSYRRELIHADIISDEEYIKRWQEVEYKGKAFDDEVKEIITEKGERVRSKSEKIIADKLYAMGIAYRYEYPLLLDGNIMVYPDFTILKMPEREEIYLEHFGMLDDARYVENVIYKLNSYERNRICLGVNLFVTYETSKKPINVKALDLLIRKRFYSE